MSTAFSYKKAHDFVDNIVKGKVNGSDFKEFVVNLNHLNEYEHKLIFDYAQEKLDDWFNNAANIKPESYYLHVVMQLSRIPPPSSSQSEHSIQCPCVLFTVRS